MLAYRASKAAENGLMVALHETYVTENAGLRAMRGADRRLHRVASIHPGYVATGLGVETAHRRFNKDAPLDYAQTQALRRTDGAIPVAEGADTLKWLILAEDEAAGLVSGKHFYLRSVVPF